MGGDTSRPIVRAAIAVATVLLALLVACSPGVAQAQAPAADGVTAAELDGRVLSLALELDGIEADLTAGTSRRAELEAAIATGRADYQRGLDDENGTRSALARYSVAAYMVGEIVPPAVIDAILTSGTGDLDNEGRRVLATTVHRELTGDARDATRSLDEVEARLDRDEAEAAALDAQLAAWRTRRDDVTAEITSTKADAARVRVKEEAAAAERARRDAEDQLRANTPRPVSHKSGVVPPRTVPTNVAALFQGQISFTAIDAYWRAAAITGSTRPGCAIDWALIAAIGKVETGHATYRGTALAPDGSTDPTILGIPLDGTNGTLKVNDTDGGALDGDPIADRAVGPMQFIPGTWRAYAIDGNGDGVADPHNIYDSALAAANYLCSSAGGGPISQEANASRAVYAYNRSSAYNAEVLDLADRFRRVIDPSLPPRVPVSVAPPDPGTPTASPDVPKDPDPTTTTTTTPETTTTTAPP